jgi:hypothetical protein
MKAFKPLFVIITIILLLALQAGAATTLTTSNLAATSGANTNAPVVVLWSDTCTAGGGATATFDAESLAILKEGYFLFSLCAYPTSGGTAPTAAYSVTAVTAAGCDVMAGKWASAGSATLEVCKDYINWPVSKNVTFTTSGGGNGGQITYEAVLVK